MRGTSDAMTSEAAGTVQSTRVRATGVRDEPAPPVAVAVAVSACSLRCATGRASMLMPTCSPRSERCAPPTPPPLSPPLSPTLRPVLGSRTGVCSNAACVYGWRQAMADDGLCRSDALPDRCRVWLRYDIRERAVWEPVLRAVRGAGSEQQVV